MKHERIIALKENVELTDLEEEGRSPILGGLKYVSCTCCPLIICPLIIIYIKMWYRYIYR
jgi:hypothetical protein